MTIRSVATFFLFPCAAWQIWITNLPNYYLQHLFIWLLVPFMAWGYHCGWWSIRGAYNLFRPALPWLSIFLLAQVVTSWHSAYYFGQEAIAKSVFFDLIKLCAQLPFLALFALLGVVITQTEQSQRAALYGVIALFLFIFIIFCLQATFVYLRTPLGHQYDLYALPEDPRIQGILNTLHPLLKSIASIFEARWKDGLYDFYKQGAYVLSLARINGIFEEASIFASHVAVIFVPLSVGLLAVGRQKRSKPLKIISWIIFLCTCLMMAACRSTTGQILAIVAILVWIFMYCAVQLKKNVLFAVVGAIIFAIALNCIPQGDTNLFKRITEGYAASGTPRAVISRGSLAVIAEHPFWGTGRSWYLPYLYAGEEYQKNLDEPELAYWKKTNVGEMSAILAFTARYGIPFTVGVTLLFFMLGRRLFFLRSLAPSNPCLGFTAPAFWAWCAMAVTTLLGSYDPRNALLLLPLSFFFGTAINYNKIEKRVNKSCCIIMHSVGGGGEKMALLLAAQLAKKEHRVVIVCLRYLPELYKHLPHGASISMPSSGGACKMLYHLLRVKDIARMSNAVVGSLELQSLFIAGLFAPGRAIGWLHKDLAGYLEQRGNIYKSLYRILFGWAASRCKTVVCVSDGIVRSSQQLFPCLKEKFVRIYNPVDLDAIRTTSKSPLPKNVESFISRFPIIIGVGRLEWQKNFSLLLDAHALLLQRGFEVGCCIVGEGSERKKLEARAEELGTSGYVLLPGFLNPHPVMSCARVLAQSSRFEGFSLVLVEALALGVPVVAVDCPSGPSEVLDSGHYGILTPPDATKLAEGIEHYLLHEASEEERECLRKRAEYFSLPQLFPAWLNLLYPSNQPVGKDENTHTRVGLQ
ncbi:glycosyltransferase [Desulfovibrio intestinalis]|uniref:Glycosyltransferase involved in cell wall biosynthesis/predicted membrane protein n=1 Tax=Desulfovibrio intestinalis TaxID=58621 RepID=A0A7W8C6J5_9BACT|nr:glycosyltransferase [Desulfovibrio intestinalis]MBB5144690.1 glycosyltransferase involved in cell wall biosynthesis/predicted membrane protein [Desulfovibrio intestinalis]